MAGAEVPAADYHHVSLRGLLFAALLGFVAATGGYAVHAWAKENGEARKAAPSVVDGALGVLWKYFDRYIVCPGHLDIQNGDRFRYLERYAPGGRCEPDREKHWRLVEKMPAEHDWPEAYWLLAAAIYRDMVE